MSKNDRELHYTSAGTDHKAATLDYIFEMLEQLSLLALGIGEVSMADDLRVTANAYGASRDSREKAPAAN